jgi:CheY-like chemotaxis protein
MIGPAMRIRLILWNAAEAEERAERLRAIGCEVESNLPSGPELLRAVRASLPDAVVIDLSRIPSQGRDLALALRSTKAMRQVPIVFVEGEAEKRAGVRAQLPDAVFASWRGIRGALKQAIEHPPLDPMKPTSALAGYSRTPLPKKLGIKPGSRVALIGAPADFAKTLGSLPEGARLSHRSQPDPDLVLWFLRSQRDLERGIATRARALVRGSMWMVWPKRTSALKTDLVEQAVREAGLAAGLVDYKVCAVDETWSGLLFTRRKPPRGR